MTDSTAPHTENDLLIAMLGASVSSSAQEDTYGWYDDENAANPNVGFASLSRPLAGARIFSTNVLVYPDSYPPTYTNSQVGSFLVRAVPEPSTALLLAAGLAALAVRRRGA